MLKKNIIISLSLVVCIGLLNCMTAQDASNATAAASSSDLQRPDNSSADPKGILHSLVTSPVQMGIGIDCSSQLSDQFEDLVSFSNVFGFQLPQVLQGLKTKDTTGSLLGAYMMGSTNWGLDNLPDDKLNTVLTNMTIAMVFIVKDQDSASAIMDTATKATKELLDMDRIMVSAMVGGPIDGVDYEKTLKTEIVSTGKSYCVYIYITPPTTTNELYEKLKNVSDIPSFFTAIPENVISAANTLKFDSQKGKVLAYYTGPGIDLDEEALDTSLKESDYNTLAENMTGVIMTDNVGSIYYSTKSYAEKGLQQWQYFLEYSKLGGEYYTSLSNNRVDILEGDESAKALKGPKLLKSVY